MLRYIDADELKSRMFNYYDCVSESTGKSNYRGETFMNYEVADMIEDCIDNAPTADVAPRAEVAREIFDEIENLLSANMSGELRGDSIERFDYFDLHLAEDIAELKNEYTEAEPPKGD